ncbi:hypothetical protein J7E43_16715 [Bacillus sp. ISL-8]|nr:hypothetical protein [Bacillus sp. ISL-8]
MDPNAKYEITNTKYTLPYKGNRYSKFPLDNTQYKKLQNMNYEDMLTDYLKNRNYAELPIITNVDWSSASSAILIVIGTFLSISAAVPGAVIISFGTLLPLFWSDIFGKPGEDTWQSLITQVENLGVGQNLTPTFLLTVNNELNRIYGYLSVYNDIFNYWESNNNANTREAVRNAFANAHAAIVGSINILSTPGFNIISLSSYASLALLHLNLLRQGVFYADQWGLIREDGAFYKQQLKERIEKYINYCQSTYRTGLERLKTGSLNGAWIYFNTYRKEYTISVLNVVATFSRFDPDMYPYNLTTKPQITEKIHVATRSSSDTFYAGFPDLKKVEDNLVPKLGLFKRLTKLNFYTTSHLGTKYLSQITNSYDYTGGNFAGTFTTNGGSNSGSPDGEMQNPWLHHCEYDQILSNYIPFTDPNYGINKLTFISGNLAPYTAYNASVTGVRTKTVTVLPPIPPIPPELPKDVVPIRYILSDMTTIESNPLSVNLLYNFSWTVESSNADNVIEGGNRITQIPAVKGDMLANGATVKEGPGHTGGPLVVLGPYTAQGWPAVNIKCKVSDAAANKNLVMGIRYASSSTTATQLNLKIGNQVLNGIVCPGTGADIGKIDIPYNKFKNIDIPTITPKSAGPMNVYIEKASNINETLLIDKIEFFIKG